MADQTLKNVTDNAASRRYELTEKGFTAFADYRRHGDVVIIPHVEAPLELQGTGAAGRLMEGIVAHARADGVKINPTCPYAAVWFQRHPADADLVA